MVSKTVNEDMQQHLNVLGITVQNGEQIKWEAITKAYRKQALKCHPDKEGGSHDAFTSLSNAFNEMEKIFDRSVTENDTLFYSVFNDGIWDSLFNENNWKLIDSLPKEQRALLNEMSEILICLLENSGINYNYFICEYVTRSETNEYRVHYKTRFDSGRSVFPNHADFLNFQNKHQQYSATSDDQVVKSIFESAMQHLNQFSKEQDIKKLKDGLKEVFDKANDITYKPFFTQIYDAFILVMRAFFRLLDYLVTFVTCSDELMADTYTPGAQNMFNRTHFFVYSTVPPEHLKKVQEFKEYFDEKVVKLESLLTSSAIVTEQNRLNHG